MAMCKCENPTCRRNGKLFYARSFAKCCCLACYRVQSLRRKREGEK